MRLKQSIARWIRLAGLRTVVGSHIEIEIDLYVPNLLVKMPKLFIL